MQNYSTVWLIISAKKVYSMCYLLELHFTNTYMYNHVWPLLFQTRLLTHGALLSFLVAITLPHWSWKTMIILYTQSSQTKDGRAIDSAALPKCIGARVVYPLMRMTGCLHNTCGYSKGRQGDYIRYRLSLYR